MKKIFFILGLMILILGGCEASDKMDEMALEASLVTVNQALEEGRVLDCFGFINEEGIVERDLVLKEDGCVSFEEEIDLESFCVGRVVSVAKCGNYVRLVDKDGRSVYYDMKGEGIILTEGKECEVGVECGGEADSNDGEQEILQSHSGQAEKIGEEGEVGDEDGGDGRSEDGG